MHHKTLRNKRMNAFHFWQLLNFVTLDSFWKMKDIGQDFNWHLQASPLFKYYFPHVLLLGNLYLFVVLLYKQFWYDETTKHRPPSILLQQVARVWNMAWCLFSFFGLIGCLREPMEITRMDPSGKGSIYFWMFLYILTKPLEIIDTLLLILNGRDVRLIHWSHHNITMLYTWYVQFSFNNLSMIFAVINFWVHAVMYGYYFLVSFERFKNILHRVSFCITWLQIAQFVFCLFYSLFFWWQGRMPLKMFLITCGMYLYYFVMFAHLYRNRSRVVKA